MKVIKEMVHTALRDDTSLRTTLGHAATPYGVYEAFFPETPDFSSKSYVTWQFLGGASDQDVHGVEMRQRSKDVAVTVWSANPDTIEDAHKRIRRVLIDMFAVTKPTSDAEVHQIKHMDEGPDLFDDEAKAYFRAETYRVKFREDVTA